MLYIQKHDYMANIMFHNMDSGHAVGWFRIQLFQFMSTFPFVLGCEINFIHNDYRFDTLSVDVFLAFYAHFDNNSSYSIWLKCLFPFTLGNLWECNFLVFYVNTF